MKTQNYKQLFKKTAMMIVLGISMNSFAQSPVVTVEAADFSPRIGSGSGGKIGSGAGGDGAHSMDNFIETSSVDGDVVVPFPGIDRSPHSLILHGEAGEDQLESIVSISICEENNEGGVIALSCDQSGEYVSTGNLNEMIKVPDGLLLVEYSGTHGFYYKKPGITLHINLRKIRLNVPDNVRFRVFNDYRSSDDFKKLAQYQFGRNKYFEYISDSIKDFCDKNNKPRSSKDEVKNLCKKLDKNKPISALEFAQVLIGVNEKSELILWDNDNDKFINLGLLSFRVTDGRSGSHFISVLPGTYGVEWNNVFNGDKTLTQGIRVD